MVNADVRMMESGTGLEDSRFVGSGWMGKTAQGGGVP